MQITPEVQKQALSMLPQLSSDERAFLNNLPNKYCLEVPYFKQTEKHFCGAACVQMAQAFFSDPVIDQKALAYLAGWSDWRHFNHETFAEDFERLIARLNFLPARYYPGAFVLSNFETGAEGADFIVGNRELFADIDFSYFKALLCNSRTPLMCRVHFVSSEYPMPEEMIQKIDNSGHSLLMVGFDEQGFIFHDPWDLEAWGGLRGGPYTKISYDFLKHIRPLVNCCKESVEPITKINSYFEIPRQAVIQGRTIDVVLNVEWPGLTNILIKSAPASDLSAILYGPKGLKLNSTATQRCLNQEFRAGSSEQLKWTIDLGDQVGSFEIDAAISCSLRIPAYLWEEHAKDEVITIKSRATTRLDVKSVDWFNKYGRI